MEENGKKLLSAPILVGTFDGDVRDEFAVLPEFDVRAHGAVGADFARVVNLGVGTDDGGGVDGHSRLRRIAVSEKPTSGAEALVLSESIGTAEAVPFPNLAPKIFSSVPASSNIVARAGRPRDCRRDAGATKVNFGAAAASRAFNFPAQRAVRMGWVALPLGLLVGT